MTLLQISVSLRVEIDVAREHLGPRRRDVNANCITINDFIPPSANAARAVADLCEILLDLSAQYSAPTEITRDLRLLL